MRPISPETQALLDRLHRSFRGFAREPADEILRQIADSGDAAVLPRLVPCLVSPEPEVFAAAARAVHRLLGQLAPRDYVWLDENTRHVSYGDVALGTRRIIASDLQRFAALQDIAPSLLGLASCNQSGYVREAAIGFLARTESGAALPFLLLRVNDWVDQVRAVALRAVEAECRQSRSADFLRFLPLVSRLEWTERGQSPDLVRRVERLLQAPENASLLAAGCLSPDHAIRRACFRIRLDAASDPWDVLRDALRSSDPFVRLWAARSASALPPTADLHDVLVRMTRDRFGSVRSTALAALAGLYPEEAREPMGSALFDSSPSIRAESRRWLAKVGPIDFAAVYRDALEKGKTSLPPAISGLGETGRAEDAPRLQPFLAHPRARVRRAAVRVLGKLTGTEYLADFLQTLGDEAPSVSTEARTVLAGRAGFLDPRALWDRFEREERPHVRKNLLLLLGHLGKWDRLPYLLRASRDRDPALADLAAEKISKWQGDFNRSFIAPTGDQMRRIEVALGEVAPRFRELDFYFKVFQR